MFFLDVFTVNSAACVEPLQREDYNFTQNSSESTRSLQLLRDNSGDNDTETVNNEVCMEMELYAYGQTMYMSGLLVGSVIGGAISDRYGKRLLLVASAALQALTALCSAFLPFASIHLAARCIAGITCSGINISSFSL
ncbi:hypothetical protein JZ751_018826, partial [Albula glossodonta]